MRTEIALKLLTVAGGLLFLMGSSTLGGEENEPDVVRTLPESETWIVIREQAVVMAGDDPAGSAPLGATVAVTHSRGPWQYAPELKGWIHQGDLVRADAAVEHFTKSLKERESSTARHLRGIAHMLDEDWERAIKDLETAYEQGDSSISLHFNLGVCYREFGDLNKALREFTSIIENFPEEFPSYMARGSLLQDLGHRAAALKDFETATEKRPEASEAWNSRGVTLRLLGRYEEAIEMYTKAIELDRESSVAVANRAYARKSLGEYQAAIDDYELALTLAPESPAIMNDLAWLLATCPDEDFRDPQRALELALAANEAVETPDGEYLDTLAAAYARLGQFDKAIEAGKKALDQLGMNPGAAAVHDRLELYESGKPFSESLKTARE